MSTAIPWTDETWNPVTGCTDYEVSDRGRVRRATPGRGTYPGRLLLTPPDSQGYPTVNLHGVPHRVHVLVAAAFVGDVKPGVQVHHENGRRSDPRAANLAILPSRLSHGERHRIEHPERRRHGEVNPTVLCACGCGLPLSMYDESGRPRRFVNGHNVERGSDGRWFA